MPELRDVVWPHKFRPEVAHKYDRMTNPHEFLQVYYTACQAVGGNTKVMANWFPLALQPETRSWLMNLPPNSIRSWDDLCEQFVGAFQGGYARPGVVGDLHILVQQPGETLRQYLAHFSSVQHTVKGATDAAIIAAFHTNVRDVKMHEKLSTRTLTKASELYALADKCARIE